MAIKIDTDHFEYVINKHDDIVDVSDSWLDFALENDTKFTRDSVIGKSLWEFISNAQTRHLYRILLDKVRKTEEYIQVPFRCDAPDRRRFMELAISSLHNGYVQFKSRILRTELRSTVALLDSTIPRSNKKICMCSWCKQIQTDAGRWMEVERALSELGLFNLDTMPDINHGICPECERRLFYQMHIPQGRIFAY